MNALLGKMIDLSDGTFITYELPQTDMMTVMIDTEQVTGGRKNAKLSFFKGSHQRLEMELVFIRQHDTLLDVELPVNWLKARCAPLLLGPTMTMPPPSFAILQPGVSDAATWELVGEMKFEGVGNANIDVYKCRPMITVRFTLDRSDETWSRLRR